MNTDMKKQTAVEWLIAEIQRLPLEHRLEKQHLYAHALAMEENQIIAAYLEGRDDEDTAHADETFERTYEDYYRETYGGDK